MNFRCSVSGVNYAWKRSFAISLPRVSFSKFHDYVCMKTRRSTLNQLQCPYWKVIKKKRLIGVKVPLLILFWILFKEKQTISLFWFHVMKYLQIMYDYTSTIKLRQGKDRTVWINTMFLTSCLILPPFLHMQISTCGQCHERFGQSSQKS